MELRAPGIETTTRQGWSSRRRQRDALSHLVVQNGVTDSAVVETRLTAADGSTFDADVVFGPSSRARVIFEVSIVTLEVFTLEEFFVSTFPFFGFSEHPLP